MTPPYITYEYGTCSSRHSYVHEAPLDFILYDPHNLGIRLFNRYNIY